MRRTLTPLTVGLASALIAGLVVVAVPAEGHPTVVIPVIHCCCPG
jgi:hypothetical protein